MSLVETEVGENLKRRQEIRFLVDKNALPEVYSLLESSGFPRAYLDEQNGNGRSIVQTLYFGTTRLKTPHSLFLRLRAYLPSPTIDNLVPNPDAQYLLEIKDRSTEGLPQVKVKKPTTLRELTDPAQQPNLIPPRALEEVDHELLVPLAAIEVNREYFFQGPLTGNYVTVDQDAKFWGFMTPGELFGKRLGRIDMVKIEIKGFTLDTDPRVQKVVDGLLSLGAQEKEPLFLENLMRDAYLKSLKSATDSSE